MENNRIKKELHKQKPTAEFGYNVDNNWWYSAEVVLDNEEYIVNFKVPVSDMGENTFDRYIPAQLLIRWMV